MLIRTVLSWILGVIVAYCLAMLGFELYMLLKGFPYWGDWRVTLFCVLVGGSSAFASLLLQYSIFEHDRKLEKEVGSLKERIDASRSRLWEHWMPLSIHGLRIEWQAVRERGQNLAQSRFSIAPHAYADDAKERRELERARTELQAILGGLEKIHQELFRLRISWLRQATAEIDGGASFGTQALARKRMNRDLKVLAEYLAGSKELVGEISERLLAAETTGKHGDPNDWYRIEINVQLSSDALRAHLSQTEEAGEN
jgi:hypothetical protein